MNQEAFSDALVLFGGTGDLARKKIYPALLSMVQHGHLDTPIVAVARTSMGTEDFRGYVRDALARVGGHADFDPCFPVEEWQNDGRGNDRRREELKKLGSKKR